MMNTQWRLDSKARGVAEAFRKARPEQQRRAALIACETVVPLVGLDGDGEVDAGLRALREARFNNAALREQLNALSARFDDEYVRLDEEGDDAKKPEVLRLFGKARGVSALALAFSDDASGLHEAIYEAISAVVDDPSKVARVVEAALRASWPN
jgi:hypothetical protein